MCDRFILKSYFSCIALDLPGEGGAYTNQLKCKIISAKLSKIRFNSKIGLTIKLLYFKGNNSIKPCFFNIY